MLLTAMSPYLMFITDVTVARRMLTGATSDSTVLMRVKKHAARGIAELRDRKSSPMRVVLRDV